MKCPSLDEIRAIPIMTMFAGLLDCMGITNEDFPDILPDDFHDRCVDEASTVAMMREFMPKIVAKIEAIDGIPS